jgi:hypothetical protein
VSVVGAQTRLTRGAGRGAFRGLVTLLLREWIITQRRVANIQVTTRAYSRLQLVYLERTQTSNILQGRMALDEELTKVSDSKGGLARF